jgi:hypothetical protein
MVVVLACEIAEVGVIPAALNVVGVLTTVVTLLPSFERMSRGLNSGRQ